MKKTGLIILIVICLIVFLTTLTGGVLLTIRTIGWQRLLDQSQVRNRLDALVEQFGFPEEWSLRRQSFSIDEQLTLDLTGIRTIEIKGVSESIVVRPTAGAGSAVLTGTYRARSPIRWIAETQGDILKIYTDWPRFGALFSDLSIRVDIPRSFAGFVKINSVSGTVTLPDRQADWQALTIGTVSGGIRVENASFADISASSVSGAIDLSQIRGTVSSKTTSGSITLHYLTFQKSSIRSVSGSVELTIPADSSVQVSYTTVSGRFKNQDIPLTVISQTSRKLEGRIGIGKLPLSVATTSGDLLIKGH